MKTTLHNFAYCLNYLRDQIVDVHPQDMVSQPNGIINHPSWVIGHITFSCQALGGEIGLREWLPADWPSRFGTGSTPIPDLTAYPEKNESLKMLNDAQSRVALAVEQLSESQLDQPLPDEKYRTILPTVRHAVAQVLLGHPAFHVGQMTLWRNAMGLPRMARPFV